VSYHVISVSSQKFLVPVTCALSCTSSSLLHRSLCTYCTWSCLLSVSKLQNEFFESCSKLSFPVGLTWWLGFRPVRSQILEGLSPACPLEAKSVPFFFLCGGYSWVIYQSPRFSLSLVNISINDRLLCHLKSFHAFSKCFWWRSVLYSCRKDSFLEIWWLSVLWKHQPVMVWCRKILARLQ